MPSTMNSERQNIVFELSRHEAQTKPCHWIATPNGDHGREWCPDCGRFKVRNLRRHDRRRRDDYILDGGWRTSHDTMPMCANCGALLSGYLTGYGASQELDYYEDTGLSNNPPVDALYLSEIIENLPDDDGRLDMAMTFARQVLAATDGGAP